jgi:hypothetical protein
MVYYCFLEIVKYNGTGKEREVIASIMSLGIATYD